MCVLILGACAAEESDPEAAAGEGTDAGMAVEVDHEAVELATSLAQARGHAAVALELVEADDIEGATLHGGHPLAEVLEPLQGELEEHGADVAALEEAFTGLAEAVASGDAAAVGEAVGLVDSSTVDAATAVSEGASEDPAFDGSVIASLLGDVAHEYGEAVAGDGSIGLLEEYQDAYGFVNEAQTLYDEVRTAVEEASAEEAEEIEEAFSVLTDAFPAASAPDDPAAAEEVEEATALIGHELEETVGALPLEDSDPEEVVAEINTLLDEIEALYADGDTEEAAELAAEAYLENYEVIEAGVIQAAPEVNEELEPLLGAELRKQMQEGASPEEISTMIERARVLLDEALAAVEEGH
ncbi:MAG TPA: hypothetical protein VJ927_08570 [Actinomycetota bacterium]|nr:hypothetical protein [Actinomycetota bacterium]